ncbi:hypothetical protein SEUCBS140593_006825 [Sporothrix eucalyptigena]|uniref:Secreted protein n=1 Tax=Sporothrix eucalyptigena TaxID=1812306 RepID=A0ABP0CAL9_9PEZI
MCEYMYYRYVSSKCTMVPAHHQRVKIYLRCTEKREGRKTCHFKTCKYRPDMDPFTVMPTDELCIVCKNKCYYSTYKWQDENECKADDFVMTVNPQGESTDESSGDSTGEKTSNEDGSEE